MMPGEQAAAFARYRDYLATWVERNLHRYTSTSALGNKKLPISWKITCSIFGNSGSTAGISRRGVRSPLP